MTKMTIEERVKSIVVDSQTRNYLKENLDTIRDNLRYTQDKFQRSFLSLFFLFAVFVFLTQAAITEVSLGPFKVTDLTLIQKLFPLLMAYYYYELASLAVFRIFLLEAHKAIIKNIYTPVFEKDLHYYLLPPFALATGSILEKATEGLLKKILTSMRAFYGIAILFLAFLFEIYAFYKCFTAYGSTDAIVWLVFIFSMVLLSHGFLLFFKHRVVIVSNSD